MMTEAEALQTLAREDPALASDARAALRWLTSGGGLEAISQLRLQEFLWSVLPSSWPLSPDGRIAVARALGRLLTLAGLERYAEVCVSADTERIITAYDEAHAVGVAAYEKAVEGSHAPPPDTDLLAWSSAPGPEEKAAFEACAAAIELAIASRELKVGTSGWKTKRAALVDRWLTGHTLTGHTPGSAAPGAAPGGAAARRDSEGMPPGTDTWLSRISAERIDEWAHGHPGERSQMARRIVPRLLEPPVLPGEPLPTLRWLLRHADAGLRLTARHYIAPALVAEAAGMFGWGERSARRHTELNVFPLHTLRDLATREMGALRRSGTSLVLTRTGRLMTDDAAVRWHIGTAALIGPDDGPDPDFTVAVREAALLVITLNGNRVNCEDLAARLTGLHAAEGWTSRSGSSLAAAVRGEVRELSHRLSALRLLAPAGAGGPEAADGAWGSRELELTSTGTAAALSALLARALRPRRHA